MYPVIPNRINYPQCPSMNIWALRLTWWANLKTNIPLNLRTHAKKSAISVTKNKVKLQYSVKSLRYFNSILKLWFLFH